MKLSLGLLIAVALGDHIHHRWPPYTPLWVLFVGAALTTPASLRRCRWAGVERFGDGFIM